MSNRALFDVNADGDDQGFVATPSQLLTFTLRSSQGVGSVLFQVWKASGFDAALGIAANPPRSSPGAPELTLDNGVTTGQDVYLATPSSEATTTTPAGTTAHSWLVRCVVDGGTKVVNGRSVIDPDLIHERMVLVRNTVGLRKVIATEQSQESYDGVAKAIGEIVDWAIGAGFPAPGNPGDNNKMPYASGGTLLYSAEFTHDPTVHRTALSHASSRLLMGAAPASTGRLSFSNGDALNWRNNPGNADLVGLDTDFAGGLEILSLGTAVGGAAVNGFDWTQLNATTRTSFFIGASERIRYDGTFWDFVSTGSNDAVFMRRGVSLMSLYHNGTIANISFFSHNVNYQSGNRILFITDRTAAPTGNPAGGGFLYCEGGALKYLGSGGTPTTVAPA